MPIWQKCLKNSYSFFRKKVFVNSYQFQSSAIFLILVHKRYYALIWIIEPVDVFIKELDSLKGAPP